MKTYIGDVGTEIELDCGQDISAASALTIEALKPDGTIVVWTGTLQGSTGISYIVPSGTLDQAGDWYLQAKVTIGAGTWYGESARLKVYERFT